MLSIRYYRKRMVCSVRAKHQLASLDKLRAVLPFTISCSLVKYVFIWFSLPFGSCVFVVVVANVLFILATLVCLSSNGHILHINILSSMRIPYALECYQIAKHLHERRSQQIRKHEFKHRCV